MRKLASVRRIENVTPIEGADAIEKVNVLGWQCVAKRGEFLPGALCVYVEIDSILPERPEFEFLRPRKFRIKTIKLRGVVSQGIVFPMSILPQDDAYRMGDDVTDILGIVKYDEYEGEEPEQKVSVGKNPLMRFTWYRRMFGGKKSGKWPEFIKHTDETRVQSMPNVLKDFSGEQMYVTEKVDGQSASYAIRKIGWGIFTKYEFYVCSRKQVLTVEDNSNWWTIAKKYDIKNTLIGIFKKFECKNTLVLQGEIYGNGIQGNKYGRKGLEFAVFNMESDGCTVAVPTIIRIIEGFGLKTVPVLDRFFFLPETIDELVEYSQQDSELSKTLREGVVIRLRWGK
jgi:hypothetical protein